MRVQRVFVLAALLCGLAAAQEAPWTSTLRGSWVETGPPAGGDVVLSAPQNTAQIVVGDDENAAVHQAADFLAGDIEKISGHKPAIVKLAGDSGATIRLVTLGHGQIPTAIDTRTMQGQWESYRILTAGRTVWLVGSNPRGTALAGYTLSERLGIDPLYI